jgi:hypothetical protein
MFKTWLGIGGKRTSKAKPSFQLRSNLWINTLLGETGLSEQDFWEQYVRPAM